LVWRHDLGNASPLHCIFVPRSGGAPGRVGSSLSAAALWQVIGYLA